jgi:hypothetical protein
VLREKLKRVICGICLNNARHKTVVVSRIKLVVIAKVSQIDHEDLLVVVSNHLMPK